MEKENFLLAVAINFGTTSSNVAFSYRDEYQTDPFRISTVYVTNANIGRMVSLYRPTVILFDEHQKFHSFGYEAEEAYSKLAMKNEQHKWYYFKRFKMILHENKIKIEDVKEKKMLASEVFRGAIEYFKDYLLAGLIERAVLQNCGIHWVLTIPAIWTVSAKQVMREAAYKAGICVTQLSIVLESEAAISFCQMIPTDKIKGSVVDIASPGTKFMVINLEDNTSDTTVYERRDDGGLRELHTANGGAWGGTKVNEELFSMIIEVFGCHIFTKFCNENWEEYYDMQSQLEDRIHMVTPKTSGKISITIPVALLQTYESESGRKVMEAIDRSPYAGNISFIRDKMRIDAQVFKNFFKPCTDKIVKNIKNLLKYPDVQGTKIFYMVGKFSKSEMIQDAITTALPRGKVIIPDAPMLAVLQGAVIFGHRPIAITSSKSKYTYGINISPPFDPTIHPEDHRVSVGGNDRCRDVFKQYISEGETVRVGEAKSGEHFTLNTNQREMLLNVYACPRQNPLFVDEGDVDYLGNIAVNLPEYADEVRVEVKMILSETELIVEAVEMSQLTKYRAYFEDL